MPGDGGFDKGAASAFGNEKTYALDVARQLRPLLQGQGVQGRHDARKRRFHSARGPRPHRQQLPRIHLRKPPFQRAPARTRTRTGFEIFSLTPRGAPSTKDDSLALHFVNMQAGSPVDAQSFELSAAVYHSMLGHIPEFDRGIKRARFAVLRHTKIPSILVEGGFLSETGDSKRVADPAWRKQLAEKCIQRRHREATGTWSRKSSDPMLASEYRAQAAGEITVVDLASPPSRSGETHLFTAVIPVSTRTSEPKPDPNQDP